MEERKKFITENTKIIMNEEAFKKQAEELICELFVNYVNKLYQATVLELKK